LHVSSIEEVIDDERFVQALNACPTMPLEVKMPLRQNTTTKGIVQNLDPPP